MEIPDALRNSKGISGAQEISKEFPRELIVDASILFSFFNRSSARREIFKKLLDNDAELRSPDFALTELSNNKFKIMKFSQINESEFDEIFSELNKDLGTVDESEYKEFLPEAGRISPHEDETKDDPYFALALSLNMPIWSDEEAFKKQSSVDIFTTSQLNKLLSRQEIIPSELRRLFEKNRVSDEDSTELIRKMRDKKYGW